MDFVERIDQLLKEKNLQRSALCDDLGLTHSAISDWKKRGTIPSGDVCLKIAEYLGADVEYLITGRQKKERENIRPGDGGFSFIQTLSALQSEIDRTFQAAIGALKK